METPPLDSSLTPIEESLEQRQLQHLVSLSTQLNATRTLQGPAATSRLPIVGPVVAALRRWWLQTTARWYTQPLLEQQNRFNEQVVRALDETARLISAQLWATHEQAEQMHHLEERLDASADERREELKALADKLREELKALADKLREELKALADELREESKALADKLREESKALVEALRLPPVETATAEIVPSPICGPAEEASYWQGQASADLLTAKIAILERLPDEPEEAYLRRFEEYGAGDARMLQRYCPPDGRVLDIGCGIGRTLKHVRAQERWGVDISSGMLEWGAMYLRGQEGIHLLQTNGFDLTGAPSDYFDLVYSIIVLQHVNKRAGFNYLCETCRVLKPGGRFVFEFMSLLSEGGFQEFQTVLRMAYPLDFYTPEEVRFKLERAGLQVDELYTKEEHLFAIGHRPHSKRE